MECHFFTVTSILKMQMFQLNFLTFFLTTYYSNRNTERESTQSEGKGMTTETDVKEKPDYDLCVQKGLT